VIECLGAFLCSGCPALVLELAALGDLVRYVRKGALTAAAKKSLLLGAAGCLAFLHDSRVVHRDLRPENFFVCGSEAAPKVKIGDLGLARPAEADIMDGAGAFPGHYASHLAPECCRGGTTDPPRTCSPSAS
jgi:serine/threonine protein kinase